MEPTEEQLKKAFEKEEKRKRQNLEAQYRFRQRREVERKVDKVKINNLLEDKYMMKYKKMKKRMIQLEEKLEKHDKLINDALDELEKII